MQNTTPELEDEVKALRSQEEKLRGVMQRF